VRSMIYKGRIFHQRKTPVKYAFGYPFYFYAFDLDELDLISKENLFFSYNKFNVFSINDKDRLDPSGGTIKEKLWEKVLTR
jgi:DUF1365 family protein